MFMRVLRLRVDAEWWLLNSKGAVKIVLLIAYLGKERFTVEKWKMGTAPTGESAATDLPEMASSISISRWEYSDKYVASDNLILTFEDLFLRNPSPHEGDIVLSKRDLAKWIDSVMAGLQ